MGTEFPDIHCAVVPLPHYLWVYASTSTPGISRNLDREGKRRVLESVKNTNLISPFRVLESLSDSLALLRLTSRPCQLWPLLPLSAITLVSGWDENASWAQEGSRGGHSQPLGFGRVAGTAQPLVSSQMVQARV